MSDAPQPAMPTPTAPIAKPISLAASPKWPDVQDDYIVRHDGHLIGRIRLGGAHPSDGSTWEWTITIPMAMPDWAHGSAESRDACVKDFTAAFQRILKETHPERLERAWELERASDERQQRRGMAKPDTT